MSTRERPQPVAPRPPRWRIAAGWRASLSSDRLDRLQSGSIARFVLSADADDIELAWWDLVDTGAHPLFVRLDDGWALTPDHFFQATPAMHDGDLRLRWINRATGEPVDTPIDAAELPALRRRMAALAQGTALAVPARWIERGWVVAAGDTVVGPQTDYGIGRVGHAFLRIETPTTRLLIDPLLGPLQRAEVDLLNGLAGPHDAVFVTHCHWDHFNPDALLHLDPATPLYVPRLTHTASITNLDLPGFAAQLGSTAVRPLDPWERVAVGDITVTALPAYGEDAGPHAPRDQLGFHVSLGGRAALILADASRDSRGTTDAVLDAVRARLGPVDLLFASCAGFHFPLDLHTRRPFHLADGGRRRFAPYTADAADLARWVSLSGARRAVPYAMFHLTADDIANDSAARDDMRHSGLAELAALLDDAPAGPLWRVNPGDRLSWTAGGPIRTRVADCPPRT